MRARWAWAVACVGLATCAPNAASASDFWDAIRGTPRGSSQPGARLIKVRAALAANDIERAAAELTPIVDAESQAPDPETWVVLGRVQSARSQMRQALASFERALALQGDRPLRLEDDALAIIRVALRERSYALGAQAAIGRAESASTLPRRAGWHTLHAHMLQAAGPEALDRAIAIYRAALVALPDYPPALLGLALAMHRQGAHEAALAVARRVRDPAMVDQGLLEGLQPRGERHARIGLWRQSIADAAAAKTAWEIAAQESGPWQEHARAVLQELSR